MIKEFSVHPKPSNKKSKIFFLISFLISALGILLYLMMDMYKGIVGIFAILMLTTSILIYTKFIAVELYYDITFDTNETPIFVVRQLTGKRQTTLCRINLADINSVRHESREEYKRHKTPKGVRRYIYAPTLFPKEVYRVFGKNRYESYELIIECSSDFADLLLEYAKEAKLLESESEE